MLAWIAVVDPSTMRILQHVLGTLPKRVQNGVPKKGAKNSVFCEKKLHPTPNPGFWTSWTAPGPTGKIPHGRGALPSRSRRVRQNGVQNLTPFLAVFNNVRFLAKNGSKIDMKTTHPKIRDFGDIATPPRNTAKMAYFDVFRGGLGMGGRVLGPLAPFMGATAPFWGHATQCHAFRETPRMHDLFRWLRKAVRAWISAI